jgi:hypothetical protein
VAIEDQNTSVGFLKLVEGSAQKWKRQMSIEY